MWSVAAESRGVATGVYGYIYTGLPPPPAKNLLWGRNYVRTATEQEYIEVPPKKSIPSKQISGYAPGGVWGGAQPQMIFEHFIFQLTVMDSKTDKKI